MTLDQIADELDAIRRISWFKRSRTARRLKVLADECVKRGDDTAEGKMLHVAAVHVGLGLVMVGVGHPAFGQCLAAAASEVRDHARRSKGGA